MTDTTTPTPEERQDWLERLESPISCHDAPHRTFTLRLLTALEHAEAERDRLRAELDWLANKLIYCPPEFTNCALDCAECRKEAARRAVAGEGEPS